MKLTLAILLFTLNLVMISCSSNNPNQIVLDQEKLDSVLNAVKKSTEDSLKILTEIRELKEERNFTGDVIKFLEYNLADLKNNQTKAEIELENAKSFHFGRTVEEKEEQITDQVSKKERYERRVDAISVALRIFRKIYRKTDVFDQKKFNSYKEFEEYKNDLNNKIHEIEVEELEGENNEMLNRFSYKSIITDKHFREEVGHFKESQIIIVTDSIAYPR